MNAVHRGDHRSQAIKQQLRYSWYKASNEVNRSSNAKAAEWEARCRAWTALISKRATEPTPVTAFVYFFETFLTAFLTTC